MPCFLKYWLPVVLWMGLIFFMSTDFGSTEHTGGILEPFLRWIVPDISHEAIEWTHFIVRKGGHLSEYGVLAVLVWRVLRHGDGADAVRSDLSCASLTFAVCAAYASSDEFHQSFVSTRTASVRDVMIDSTGALVALSLILLWRGWWKRGATL